MLGTLLFTVLLLTALCIVVPLFVATDRAALTGAAPLVHVLRRHRPRLHAGRDVADAAPDRRARPPHLRADRGAVLAAARRAASAAALTSRDRAATSVGPAGLVRLGGAARAAGGVRRHHAAADRTASRAPRRRSGSPSRPLMLAVPGLFMGMAFPLGLGLAPDPAGADALALGRQRRDLGVRIGARGGDRAQHDHLDRVLGRLLLLRGRPGGVRPRGKARAGSSRRSGHDGGRRRRSLRPTGWLTPGLAGSATRA